MEIPQSIKGNKFTSNKMPSKTLARGNRAIFYLLYSLVLVTPILFTSKTNEQFEFPKMFFVYAIGSTLMLVFILQKIFSNNFKVKLPHIAVFLFLLTNIISTIFSTHVYTSLWGYYTRFNGGLVSLLIFLGVFCISANATTGKQRKLLTFVAFANLIPLVVGIYHYFTINSIKRIYSTLGQPNWLGAFVGMTMFLLLDYFFKTKQKNQKMALFLIFLLNYTTLWLTYSISSLVGVAIAGLYFLIVNKNLIKKQLNYLALIVISATLISVITPGIFGAKIYDIYIDLYKTNNETQISENMQNADITKQVLEPIETNNTYNQPQNKISDTGYIRWHLWKGTLDLSTSSYKNFLIGTGPETFPYEFQDFRPKELNYSSEWDFILNKPHNYYLQLLSEIGVLGLISYFYLIFYILKSKNNKYIPALLVFFVTNLFSWPTVTTSLLFWVLFSFIEADKFDLINENLEIQKYGGKNA